MSALGRPLFYSVWKDVAEGGKYYLQRREITGDMLRPSSNILDDSHRKRTFVKLELKTRKEGLQLSL